MNECICKICGYDIYPDKFRGGEILRHILFVLVVGQNRVMKILRKAV